MPVSSSASFCTRTCAPGWPGSRGFWPCNGHRKGVREEVGTADGEDYWSAMGGNFAGESCARVGEERQNWKKGERGKKLMGQVRSAVGLWLVRLGDQRRGTGACASAW